MRRSSKILFITAVAVMLGTGCVRGQREALPFAVKDLGGTAFAFEPAHLQRPVVLVFWATWCGPCREKVPELKALHEAQKDHLDILALSVDQSAGEATEFMVKENIPYKILWDSSNTARQYGVWAIPRIFIIDAHGKVRFNGTSLSRSFRRTLDDVLRGA